MVLFGGSLQSCCRGVMRSKTLHHSLCVVNLQGSGKPPEEVSGAEVRTKQLVVPPGRRLGFREASGDRESFWD